MSNVAHLTNMVFTTANTFFSRSLSLVENIIKMSKIYILTDSTNDKCLTLVGKS